MTRYLLDTNVVSEATRSKPSQPLLDWLAQQRDGDLFISTLTLAELRRGVLEKPAGQKKRQLENWFNGPEGPRALFRGRILSFDETAAGEWARIMAAGTGTGRPRSPLDMIIAATAAANRCVVASLNARHFQGVVEFINPSRPGT